MEATFHLLFEIVKVLILGYVYTTLTIWLLRLFNKSNSVHWVGTAYENISRSKLPFSLAISLALFSFMFTHWGDHGLGDSARIPLAYGREIEETNGVVTSIPNTNNQRGDVDIEKFTLADKYICGEVIGDTLDYAGKYFVFDLRLNEMHFLKGKPEYEKYAKSNGLPTSDTFKDFYYYYEHYWNGWRFFLLA